VTEGSFLGASFCPSAEHKPQQNKITKKKNVDCRVKQTNWAYWRNQLTSSGNRLGSYCAVDNAREMSGGSDWRTYPTRAHEEETALAALSIASKLREIQTSTELLSLLIFFCFFLW
jgi:hypothetical protein